MFPRLSALAPADNNTKVSSSDKINDREWVHGRITDNLGNVIESTLLHRAGPRPQLRQLKLTDRGIVRSREQNIRPLRTFNFYQTATTADKQTVFKRSGYDMDKIQNLSKYDTSKKIIHSTTTLLRPRVELPTKTPNSKSADVIGRLEHSLYIVRLHNLLGVLSPKNLLEMEPDIAAKLGPGDINVDSLSNETVQLLAEEFCQLSTDNYEKEQVSRVFSCLKNFDEGSISRTGLEMTS